MCLAVASGMRFLKNRILVLVGVLFLVGCGDDGNKTSTGSTSGGGGVTQIEKPENAIEGQYIFAFDPKAVAAADVQSVAEALVKAQGGTLDQVYDGTVIGFMASKLDDTKALAIGKDKRVKGIMQDCVFSLDDVQTGAPWGLDRIDSHPLALDGSYTYNGGNGAGVHVYVMDTGIRRTHQDFGGRAEFGTAVFQDANNDADCNGHGTHVAGTVAGTKYGVAKGATVHSVRAFGCTGASSASYVMAGIDWVTKNHVKPAVMNMSLGGPASTMVDDAIRASIAAGVVYVAAAGNVGKDACLYSPARMPEMIVVGATDKTDLHPTFSNFGTCVDIFAPGVNIESAGAMGDTLSATLTGTSMATPHVAGVVALYLQQNPTATQADVQAALLAGATPDVVMSPAGSPNKLLYSRFMEPKVGFTDTAVWNGEFSDAAGWNATGRRWQTIEFPDVNGDGLDDMCAFAADGIRCGINNGKGAFAATTIWTSTIKDGTSWDQDLYRTTIRYADINGDGKMDICGRGYDGVTCGLSTGTAFAPFSLWSDEFSEVAGWAMDPAYYGTIRFPDVNGDGKADVCGRYWDGLHCGVSIGTAFGATAIIPSYDDAGNWGSTDKYWATLAYPDLDGDGISDVCGRGGNGLVCATAKNFLSVTTWSTNFSDVDGWTGLPSYWTTIQYADLNGDKLVDVCGRASDGLQCALSDGTKFAPASLWSADYSDAADWKNLQEHYGTIRLQDINGDGKADVCGRGVNGILCATSTGAKFNGATLWDATFSDAAGYNKVQSTQTIRFPRLNNDARRDICMRGANGVLCGLAAP